MKAVMDVLRIEGGRRLSGVVDVPGSKNAALAILASVPVINGVVTLTNLPDVSDVRTKLKLLEQFGAVVEQLEGATRIDLRGLTHFEPDEQHVRSIRTSFYLLGPLMARVGKAKLPMPGGCNIGARPVDYHMKGLAAMGYTLEQESGHYVGSAQNALGSEIHFDFPSAGATQHLMATAALTPGQTVITNAAMEPEVQALAAFLEQAGARIEGAGTSTITIQGVRQLGDVTFRVPEDRIQAGTYLMAGAITGGDVTVRGILPLAQSAVVNKLREAGTLIEEGHDWLRLTAPERLEHVRVRTMPYPGFATDMQQPMAAVLTLAEGTSTIEETIYEGRYGHVNELNRMGADIEYHGRTFTIRGVERLSGADVEASDLRAGAALVLAGLAASGTTTVRNVHFIDRGYQDLEQTLNGLGASVKRAQVEPFPI